MTTTPRVAVAALAIPLATLSGCVGVGSSWAPPIKGSSASTVAHVAGKPISIETVNGGITLSPGGEDQVTIDAELRAATKERLALVEVKSERQADGALRIWVAWPEDKRESNEGASLTIRIPDAVGVHAKTSNGSIRLTGLAGKAVLDTSNGSIIAADHAGPVHADTSNARVEVTSPAGPVVVDTSNGGVKITDAPGPVTVDTSNASVHVTLTDDSTGPVKIDTSNGSIRLLVGAAFLGELTIDTSNGSIRLPAVAKVMSKSRNRAAAVFGDAAGAPASRLDTNNASVTVEAR